VITETDTINFNVRDGDRLESMMQSGPKTFYAYDALGRRISQGPDDNETETMWTYDEASRLTAWSKGTSSATYTYDGNGQRTSATVAVGSTTTTTTYTYDGITLLSLDAARSDETTYAVAYLYDEDGRPYAGVYTAGAASPVTFLIATTDRGDVVALTNTAGDVFARYTYDPYGAVLSQDANAVTGITSDVAAAIATRQPLRYAGYAYDAHSATYYLSQRHYDPATMRFLSKDPARDDGEESTYQYCAGDPVGKVDPTGLLYWRIRDLGKEIDRTCNRWWRYVPKLGGWWLLSTIGKNEVSWLRRAREIMYGFYRNHDKGRYSAAKAYVDFHGRQEGLRQYFERRGPSWGNYLYIKRKIAGWKSKGAKSAGSSGKLKVR
jgi:RHS repeat-associated protein